jgi:hypothetical protein
MAWRISAPGAGRQHQRHHAHDEGKAGHQDGAQPQPGGMDGGLDGFLAADLQLAGEFHDQDGVLAGQPDQHEQADLGEDVVVAARQPDTGDGAEQAHRHDQDDRQRQEQAFILGGQHQEDQQHAERKTSSAVSPARIC